MRRHHLALASLALPGLLACAHRIEGGGRDAWDDTCRELSHAAEDTADLGGRYRLSGALQATCPTLAADAVAAALMRTRHDPDSSHHVAWREAVYWVVDAAVHDSALAVLADSSANLGARLSAYVLLERMESVNRNPTRWTEYPVAEDSLRACHPAGPYHVSSVSTTHATAIRVRPLTPTQLARGAAVRHDVGSSPRTPRPLRFRLGYCPAGG